MDKKIHILRVCNNKQAKLKPEALLNKIYITEMCCKINYHTHQYDEHTIATNMISLFLSYPFPPTSIHPILCMHTHIHPHPITHSPPPPFPHIQTTNWPRQPHKLLIKQQQNNELKSTHTHTYTHFENLKMLQITDKPLQHAYKLVTVCQEKPDNTKHWTQ